MYSSIMSFGEECELHDLVKQTLEKSGSMSKIRAELRANVFLALEENGCFENLKTKNNHLQEFAKNSDGLLLLCLIREFLDYYGLSFTAAVFDPELASYGIECDCKDYLKLGSQLNISDYSDSKKGPLLCEMLQIIRNFQNNSTQRSTSFPNTAENSQLPSSKSTDSSTEYYPLPIQPVPSLQVTRIAKKPKESDFEDDNDFNSKVSASKFNNNLSISSTVFGGESDSSRYSLSSLGDLPPLTSHTNSTKNIPSPFNNSSKQMHKLKAMLMDPTLPDNNEDISNSSIIDDEKENDMKVLKDIIEEDEKNVNKRI